MQIFQKIANGNAYIISLAISSTALLISFVLEFLYLIDSCELCKVQRLLFLLIFLSSAAALMLKKNHLIFALIFFSVVNVGAASYHLGIQCGIIRETCKVTSVKSLADFETLLTSKKKCSEIDATFFKLPLPIYSILGSLICLFFFLKDLKEIELKN